MTRSHSHCGVEMRAESPRVIQPMESEQAQGIVALSVVICTCCEPDCRRRFFYATPYFEDLAPGFERRLKRPEEIASMRRRLKLPKQADWVWSWHRETFAKVKWTTR